MQTQYLNSLLATASEFGLPIDSESTQIGNAGKPSWSFSPLGYVCELNFLIP